LPASPDTVVLYLADLLPGKKLATLQRRLAAIAAVHRQSAAAVPIDAAVREFLGGARRARGCDEVRKAALTVEDLRKVVRRMPPGVRAARDRAMLLVSFALGCRRSEMLALDCEDVTFCRKGAVVRLRKSKSDQEGKGREIGLFPGRSALTCPITALRAWLRYRGKHHGPLFVGVGANGQFLTKRMTPVGWSKNLKVALAAAGLDPERYGTHSLRAGMITAAVQAGVPESSIMQRSGHKSIDVMMRYVRPASVFSVNPLAKAL
jgi:integrase